MLVQGLIPALQRVLLTARKLHDLRDLGFGDLVRKDADDRDALAMHGQHDFDGLRMAHVEQTFKNMDDEFHRREIIVQEQNFIHRRALCPRAGLDRQIGFLAILGFIGHLLDRHEACNRDMGV